MNSLALAAGGVKLPALSGFLFDLDGVLTPTVEIHKRAWRELFEAELRAAGVEPYVEADYFSSLDGRPRYAGVAAVLASRQIELPWGSPSDPATAHTVCGLGNRKNELFREVLARDGIAGYPGTLRLLERLSSLGRNLAVVSSSRNTPEVLAASGLADLFPVVIDGVVAAKRGLAGKPAPDTYLAAAAALGLTAADCAVFEDAESGVAAGRAGEFGLVIGVDRGAGEQALRDSGADLVVDDLAELLPFFTSVDSD